MQPMQLHRNPKVGPGAPRPLPKVNDYDKKQLRRRHAISTSYVNKQMLSPRARKFWELYRDCTRTAMMAETEGMRRRATVHVKLLDDMPDCYHFRTGDTDQLFNHMEQDLLELREYEYYIRYGDRLSSGLPEQLGTYAATGKPPDGFFTKRIQKWTEISNKMKEEAVPLPVGHPNRRRFHRRITSDLQLCCDTLGLKQEVIIAAIHAYAGRDKATLRNLDSFILLGYSEVAKILYADLVDVGTVFYNSDDNPQIASLLSLIQSKITEWFDVKDAFHAPRCWVAKPALEELRAKVEEAADSEQANSQIAGQQQVQTQQGFETSEPQQTSQPETKDFGKYMKLLKLEQDVSFARWCDREIDASLLQEGYGWWDFAANPNPKKPGASQSMFFCI